MLPEQRDSEGAENKRAHRTPSCEIAVGREPGPVVLLEGHHSSHNAALSFPCYAGGNWFFLLLIVLLFANCSCVLLVSVASILGARQMANKEREQVKFP